MVGCCFLCVVDVDILVGVVAGLSPFDDSRCISRKMNVGATKEKCKAMYEDALMFSFSRIHMNLYVLCRSLRVASFQKDICGQSLGRLESFTLTDYVNTQIVYVKPLPLFSR